MPAGGFFFNGKQYTSPAVVSAVNDSALVNSTGDVGQKLVLVGQSTDGQPNTELNFTDFPSLQKVLGTGDLVNAARAAFTPSNDPDVLAPQSISCIRVNPATPGTAQILDTVGSAVITLTSRSYGTNGNLVSYSVAAGSVQGFLLTVNYGSQSYQQDNVYATPFSIQYGGGGGSATMTITDTTLTLFTPTGTSVGVADLVNTYTTVNSLVQWINTIPGFTATVLYGYGNWPTNAGLDPVAAQDVKTAVYTATANRNAVINWFNSSPFVTAVRNVAGSKQPAATPTTYLSGASNGSVTNTQWSNAFTLMETIDCQWFATLSPAAAIQDMGDAHAQYMSTVGRSERRQFTGTASATTDAQGIAAAASINSDRTALLHIGYYDYDVVTGAWTLYPPYILAALCAGGFSGATPGTPLTNKVMNVRGLERILTNPNQTDPLIKGGVFCLTSGSNGFYVVESVSTWLQDSKFDKVEISCGAALDFATRYLRNAELVTVGNKNGPANLALAISAAETALTFLSTAEPTGPGVLVGDDSSPPWQGLSADLTGDHILVTVQMSPVIPNNFVGISVYAVPFQGTLSATSGATPQ